MEDKKEYGGNQSPATRWITESGVGGTTGMAFVVVGPEDGPRYRMEAASARELGYSLVAAANAADRDLDLLTLVLSMGMTYEIAAQMLSDLRVISDERQSRQAE